jgi:sterol desaturase/sphingolipid hydroxylase (fatty acid hydroxylase superfamily)
MNASSSSPSDPPIRLFRSDFLEFFSHISPITVAVIWSPVVIFFLARSILQHVPGTSGWYIPLGVAIGWFLWTFVEYTLHRFLFHYHPRTERLKRYFFLMHGVHHAQPMCRTRLVMPPVISVPLALVFYGLLHAVVVQLLAVPRWFDPLLAGFVGGYLVYDIMHYNIHHSKVKRGPFFRIRKHHLRHHGRCDFLRFGVTFSLWDRVFGTMPQEDCAKILERMQKNP